MNLAYFIDNIFIIVICFSYQYIDNSWKTLQYGGILISVLSLYYILYHIEESPKFLYNQKKYQESRRVLQKIASTNSIHLIDFRFEDETSKQETIEEHSLINS